LAASTLSGFTGQKPPFQTIAYKTTLNVADTATDSGQTDSTEPVFTFTFEGEFTATTIPAPHTTRLASMPTGKYAVVTISQTTGEVRTFGVGDHAPDTAALGIGAPLSITSNAQSD
jgi:hypothetical protein